MPLLLLKRHLVLWFLLLFASLGRTGEAQSNADIGESLMDLLQKARVQARLHQSLISKYAPTNTPYPVVDKEGYTKALFPVPLSDFEEWPTVMGYPSSVLKETVRSNLVEICDQICRQSPGVFQPVERIQLQAALWATFDSVYLYGIDPRQSSKIDTEAWRSLLWKLAQTMRHLAYSTAQIRKLPDSMEVRRAILRPLDPNKMVELYWLDGSFVHDAVNENRRLTHISYYDPTVDFRNLSDANVDAFMRTTKRLSPGGVAFLEEDALAISTDLQLVPTQLPLLIKTYQMSLPSGSNNSTPEFSIFRLKRKSLLLNANALERFPTNAEAWAFTDLPNVPGYGNNIAYRAPYALVCAGCHGGYPRGFDPGFQTRNRGYLQLTTQPQTFSANWDINIKVGSSEWKALMYYWSASGQSEPLFTMADSLPVPAEIKGKSFPWLAIAAVFGLVASILLMMWISKRMQR